MFCKSVVLENRGSTQGQQPYHRADFQACRVAVRKMEQIVKEPVSLVPHRLVISADTIHGIGDPCELLKEAGGHFLVSRVKLRQNERDLQHAETIECHPGRAVGLVQMPARWQWSAAIKNTNVIEPKESAREYVASFRIFAIEPPIEIQIQPLKRPLEKAQVGATQLRL